MYDCNDPVSTIKMESSQRVRAILSFVNAADTGSFAAAARALGISSAAVSKNVAGLEKALGIRLMNRTTRTLQLTEEGKIFLQQARLGLEMLDNAVDTVTNQRLGPSGRIRISTIATFGRDHLLPLIPKLLERYPSLFVEIDFDDRVVDMVREGYDFAIRGGSIPDSALVSRQIFSLATVMVAAPAYVAREGVPDNPGQLRLHRLIARSFLDGRVATWSFVEPNGDVITFDPADIATLTLSAPDAVIQAACDGVGIANIGLHLAWPHLLSGALKIVLLGFHHPGNYEMVLQYPHRALMAPRVKAVLEFLLEAFKNDKRLHVSLEGVDRYVASS